MRNKSLVFLARAFGVLGVLSSAHAHDIVVFARAGHAVSVQYGHPGDWQVLDPNRLVDLEIRTTGSVTTSQSELQLAPDRLSGRVPLAEGATLISARYDNGFWSKLTDGSYRNARRTELSGVSEAISSFKFAKAWIAGDSWRQVVGHGLEIVPVGDRSTVKPGSDLAIRVLWQGAPLADVGVEIGDGVTVRQEADIPRYRTDAQGVAIVPLSANGWQVIAVDHEVPSQYPPLADKDRFVATFTFWLGPKEGL